MTDFLSIGELLIDFTPTGETDDGRLLFARNAGGAPANVAVQAKRTGVCAGFIGCVGRDMFGEYLYDVLKECEIDVSGLTLDEDYATSLAFVELDEKGDRNFSFYRNPGADTRLELTDDVKALIDNSKMICYGSLLRTAEPAKSAVPEIAKYAKSRGVITAYDPNWRPPLWKSETEGVEMMSTLIPTADIMKISEEELELITGESDMELGAKEFLVQGVSVVIVTLGPKGCMIFTNDFNFELPTYDTKVIDTTGSGDSFFGAFLSKVVLSNKKPNELTEDELKEFADFANAAGAICATKMGAIPAIATTDEILKCIKETPKLVL